MLLKELALADWFKAGGNLKKKIQNHNLKDKMWMK